MRRPPLCLPQDAGSQQVGFLLGSCGVALALTTDACQKGLPKAQTGEVATFKGGPLAWAATSSLTRCPGTPGGCCGRRGSGLASAARRVLGVGRMGSGLGWLVPHVDGRPSRGADRTSALSLPHPWQVGLPWPGW